MQSSKKLQQLLSRASDFAINTQAPRTHERTSAQFQSVKNYSMAGFCRCFLLLLFLPLLVSCHREGLTPGYRAPAFTLSDLQGKQVSLEQFAGKVVLLNFWATFCGPCIEEMPALQKLHEDLSAKGFVVLAVAVSDRPEKVSKFVDDNKITFPVLLDPDAMISDNYKVSGFPESFVLDKQGKLTLFPDPERRNLVLKIVGARDWGSAEIRTALTTLMQ